MPDPRKEAQEAVAPLLEGLKAKLDAIDAPGAPREVREDPRVVGLANCLLFALAAFRDRPVYDNRTKAMRPWKAWFRQALREAGYTDLPQVQDEERKG